MKRLIIGAIIIIFSYIAGNLEKLIFKNPQENTPNVQEVKIEKVESLDISRDCWDK